MRLFLKILTSALLISTFNSAIAENKPVMNVQHWQTKNGVQVYFIAAPELPMVDISVVFNAGSARDGAAFGLSQATIAMLNQGAGQLNADQIAANFENVGAQYAGNITRDFAAVRLRSLSDPKFLNPALQTLTTVLTTPTFPQDGWQLIQKQMLIALAEEQQSPMQIARNAFAKTLYGNQPYGYPIAGTVDTVSKLSLKDLKDFYKKYYVANNAIVAMVGAIDRTTAAKIAEQIVAALPTGEAAKPLATMVGPKQAETKAVYFPSQQTTIFIGQVGINQLDPDFFPLSVGNHILGGGILTSRLFEEVRNKRGLTYGVSSRFALYAANGPFYIALQSRNDQANNAIAITQQTLQKFISDGPTDKELVAAKKNIIGEFPLHFSSNADLLENLVDIAFYHLPLDYYDNYRQKVDAVMPSQIRNAFQQRIHPNTMVTVTVGQPVSSLSKNSEK